jgi:hypothetical protein
MGPPVQSQAEPGEGYRHRLAARIQGVTNSNALAERTGQLRPIKRRIDFIFSVLGLVVVVLVGVPAFSGILGIDRGNAQQ